MELSINGSILLSTAFIGVYPKKVCPIFIVMVYEIEFILLPMEQSRLSYSFELMREGRLTL
jgi:hypothetical protein